MKRYSIYQSKIAVTALDTVIDLLSKDMMNNADASEESLAQLKILVKMRKGFRKKREFIII